MAYSIPDGKYCGCGSYSPSPTNYTHWEDWNFLVRVWASRKLRIGDSVESIKAVIFDEYSDSEMDVIISDARQIIVDQDRFRESMKRRWHGQDNS